MYRLILIILIIYIVYRLLVRYIIPYLVKNFIKRQQEKFFEQNPSLKKEPLRKEGDVVINHLPDNNKDEKKDTLGDYVDYEDVD